MHGPGPAPSPFIYICTYYRCICIIHTYMAYTGTRTAPASCLHAYFIALGFTYLLHDVVCIAYYYITLVNLHACQVVVNIVYVIVAFFFTNYTFITHVHSSSYEHMHTNPTCLNLTFLTNLRVGHVPLQGNNSLGRSQA
ncbi:hypothetical protein SORBI_3008G176266 [Sorghum bicolor]|jgi:hypothetical protein|uniref:Uncharacterized protein n=1 Tax=Sorghum bicolor TaxID=4558 RepID=A0A1Z5R790_SORBI|nr:hypothetical protein SORBI_3008G176266 [Sorghum bicolor]